MTLQENIGRNIRLFREAQALTQEQVAEFLAVKRPMISYYENGEREIPISHLDKLSALFGIELSILMEENQDNLKSELAFAFRADGLSTPDLQEIAGFKRMVKNFLRMRKIKNEGN
jgi:transcriptional regulator with XRE-family HTH domain